MKTGHFCWIWCSTEACPEKPASLWVEEQELWGQDPVVPTGGFWFADLVLLDSRATPGVHVLGEPRWAGLGVPLLTHRPGGQVLCSYCLAWTSPCFVPLVIASLWQRLVWVFCLASVLSWVIKSRIDLLTWAELKRRGRNFKGSFSAGAGRLADSALVPSRGFFPQCWSSFPHRRLIAKVWVRNNEVN